MAIGESREHGLFSTVARSFKLLLTAAASVWKDERSFSMLKLVKNHLRNSMGETRLDSLMLLTCECDLTDQINLDDVVKVWCKFKERPKKLLTNLLLK